MPESLRLLILGAHPDDAEYHAGGLASIYRALGHDVKMVSVTDGGAGHHTHARQDLVRIRRAEAEAAGRVIGVAYETWDNPDGALLPTLAVREQIIREIRTFRPDLVVTHRTNDYHPDHRSVGQAVQDASYLVTVPLVVPDVSCLARDPVVAYMVDLFTTPCPFRPDVVLDVSSQLDTIVEMLEAHRSQFYEFLPSKDGLTDQVPEDAAERRAWLRDWFVARTHVRVERFRDALIAEYGPDRGNQVRHMEAYEISEYAAGMDEATRRRLFPSASEAAAASPGE